jgi:hypothetical protein
MKNLYWTFAILAVGLLGDAPAQDAPQLDIEKYELANGLDVVFYENHSLPKVSVQSPTTWAQRTRRLGAQVLRTSSST